MTNSSIINVTWVMMMMMILLLLTTQLHPAPILIMCMMYNMILCINMYMTKSNSLLPLMFILMMISGLLIIFLYFSSLISNEKPWTKYKWSTLLITMITILTTMITLTILTNHNNTPHMMNSSDHMTITTTSLTENCPTTMMFKTPMHSMTLISMIYLLMCLMTVIKITSPKIKTLRKLT